MKKLFSLSILVGIICIIICIACMIESVSSANNAYHKTDNSQNVTIASAPLYEKLMLSDVDINDALNNIYSQFVCDADGGAYFYGSNRTSYLTVT